MLILVRLLRSLLRRLYSVAATGSAGGTAAAAGSAGAAGAASAGAGRASRIDSGVRPRSSGVASSEITSEEPGTLKIHALWGPSPACRAAKAL